MRSNYIEHTIPVRSYNIVRNSHVLIVKRLGFPSSPWESIHLPVETQVLRSLRLESPSLEHLAARFQQLQRSIGCFGSTMETRHVGGRCWENLGSWQLHTYNLRRNVWLTIVDKGCIVGICAMRMKQGLSWDVMGGHDGIQFDQRSPVYAARQSYRHCCCVVQDVVILCACCSFFCGRSYWDVAGVARGCCLDRPEACDSLPAESDSLGRWWVFRLVQWFSVEKRTAGRPGVKPRSDRKSKWGCLPTTVPLKNPNYDWSLAVRPSYIQVLLPCVLLAARGNKSGTSKQGEKSDICNQWEYSWIAYNLYNNVDDNRTRSNHDTVWFHNTNHGSNPVSGCTSFTRRNMTSQTSSLSSCLLLSFAPVPSFALSFSWWLWVLEML